MTLEKTLFATLQKHYRKVNADGTRHCGCGSKFRNEKRYKKHLIRKLIKAQEENK